VSKFTRIFNETYSFIAKVSHPEALFLVVCNPPMNEL
jgi:hypothetical protein